MSSSLSDRLRRNSWSRSMTNLRLGSLSKEHGGREVKKERDKDEVKVAEDVKVEPTLEVQGGLIQRCVIIQRDEKGYGLTVSGDNPVFVQSVKENGAAARAGVKQGDRIIKVNGSLVTNFNHIEVVKLIKSGSYVALTLLGRPPGSHTKPLDPPPQPQYRASLTSPSSERITAPQPVNAQKDQEFKSSKLLTIRMMHKQAVEIYQKTKQEYDRNPSEKLQHELADKNKTVRALEAQIHGLTGTDSSEISILGGATSPHSTPPPPYSSLVSPSHSLDVANDNLDTSHNEAPALSATSPAEKHNPAPWLPDGPKHRKHDSMPDSMYQSEDMESMRGVSVARSHSDSKKRKITPSDSSFGLAEKIDEDRAKTPSLPSDTTSSNKDSSPQASPAPSPTPPHHQMASPVSPTASHHTLSPTATSHQHSDIWMEDGSVATTDGTDADQSPHEVSNYKMGPLNSASSSPTPDLFRQTATLQVQMPHQANVISVEDDEFSTDDEHLDDHGAFADLTLLKQKPAHMAVFLYYLTSNSDPSPLLFHLVTDSYTLGNLKEMRKWAYEIHSTFLADKAPLRVNVDSGVVDGVDAVLTSRADREDALRSVFQAARTQTFAESCELLADFRNKRSLGLGSLYGAHELQDENMDRQSELRIVEKYLMPHLENLLSETNGHPSDRNAAMASALATFLRQVGVSQSRNSNILERCPSFNVKDKKMFKFPKSNKKIHYTRGHHFIATHYYTVTYCIQCAGILWGIGNQGFVCMNCECNIHKNCFEKVHELCAGRKKKERGKSIMDKIITRKPSSNNPAAIPPYHHTVKEAQTAQAQKLSEDLPASPSSLNTAASTSSLSQALFHIQPMAPHDAGGGGTTGALSGTAADDEDLAPSRVGKLVDRYQEIGRSPEEQKSPVIGGLNTPRSHSPAPSESEEHRKNITLNRSESLNRKKEKESRHAVRRTRSDVQVDELTIRNLDNSGSSSNSSLSVKSLDSPSNSTETVNDVISHPQRAHQNDDSDFEVESELPPLDAFIPKDVLRKLKPKEKKRQEVINELFYTERNHVRNLKVMQRLFKKPMEGESWIEDDFIRYLFPNLDNMIDVHSSLNTAMKNKKKENPVVGDVADILLNRFSRESGEIFKTTCATFCRKQAHALEVLKSKLRKESKLERFLGEIESHPLCRRLQLKDLIPTSMQRLTKYPLLIENLMKYTQANTAEHENLQKAMTCSKAILSYVDQAVKDCDNELRLADMQRRLDKRPIENSSNTIVAEYKNLDLTGHKLVYDGPLTWRIGRSKNIDLHVILLEDILVLLQKQDEKLVLKCQSTTMVTGKEDTKFTHSPIIRLANLLTRNVATDKKAFFLVSTSSVGPQIYELVALSSEERRRWFKHITEAAETYKKTNRDAPLHRLTNQPPPLPTPPVDKEIQQSQHKRPPAENKEVEVSSFELTKSSSAESINENTEKVEIIQMDQAKLILPDQVVVAGTVLQAAEATSTPIADMIKTKDEIVRQALHEKQQLVAEVLHLPADDFENIAEMAAEVEGEKDARELVLASILQTNRLSALLNESIRMPEDPPGEAAASLDDSSVKSGSVSSLNLPPDVTLGITSQLNNILTQLLSVVSSQDEEKERLNTELKTAREQLAAMTGQAGVDTRSSEATRSAKARPDSYISVTSSASEVGDSADDAAHIATSASDDPTFLVSPTSTAAPYSMAGHVTIRPDAAVSVVQESDVVQLQEPVFVSEPLQVQEPVTVHSHEAGTEEVTSLETLSVSGVDGVETAHVETGCTAQVHVTDIDEESAITADTVAAGVQDQAFKAEQMLHAAVDVLVERKDLTTTAEEVHVAQRVFAEDEAVLVQQQDCDSGANSRATNADPVSTPDADTSTAAAVTANTDSSSQSNNQTVAAVQPTSDNIDAGECSAICELKADVVKTDDITLVEGECSDNLDVDRATVIISQLQADGATVSDGDQPTPNPTILVEQCIDETNMAASKHVEEEDEDDEKFEDCEQEPGQTDAPSGEKHQKDGGVSV